MWRWEFQGVRAPWAQHSPQATIPSERPSGSLGAQGPSPPLFI